MPITKTNRKSILKHAIAQMKLHGYSNTTMSKIGDACGLIKGSIYHHFSSKEELGLECLRYIHAYFQENIFSIAYRNDIEDADKIVLFVEKTDEYFLKSSGGCLLGNFALEAAHDMNEYKEEIKAYFSNWENALAYILEKKYGQKEAKTIANDSIATLQGAIMMMNLYDEDEGYLRVGKKLIQQLS